MRTRFSQLNLISAIFAHRDFGMLAVFE